MNVSGSTTRSALRHAKSLPKADITNRTPSSALCGTLRSPNSCDLLAEEQILGSQRLAGPEAQCQKRATSALQRSATYRGALIRTAALVCGIGPGLSFLDTTRTVKRAERQTEILMEDM